MKRVYEHKNKFVDGFSKKYHLVKLVYCEPCDSIEIAIAREKQIKGWLRARKIVLIQNLNPEWKDLYDEIV